MAEIYDTGTRKNIRGIQDPRYGVNVAGTQVSDRLTQEAFHNQERINQELNSRIQALSSRVDDNNRQLKNIAEAIQRLLD